MKKWKCITLGITIIVLSALLLAATGDETASITSSSNEPSRTSPVWERVVTAVYDADDTGNVTTTVNLTGILLKVILDVPDTTSAANAEVEILDSGSHKVFDSGDQAENDSYFYNTYEPFADSFNVVIGPDAAMGTGGGTITVTLRGI